MSVSCSGSSLEFPPNIEFYRNTLESEGAPPAVRPSMMDLVEGIKAHQKQPQRQQESVYSVELFRERNVEILEGQQRAVGKLRNQPRRSDSDSSKVIPIVITLNSLSSRSQCTCKNKWRQHRQLTHPHPL